MARPLLPYLFSQTSTHFSNSTTLLFLLAAVAAISAGVMHLCTTHKHSKPRAKGSLPLSPPQSDRKLLSTLSSNIGGKATVVAKLISWKKSGDEDEAAVWKKTIIMGEKCRPLDFSGQILYDSEGNQVAQPPRTKPHGGDGGAL